MTPEQREALAAVRDLYANLPAQPSPELAASWWIAVRATIRDVVHAFPEGGQDDQRS